ncbi:hypothetical protein PSENEW3_00003075 [Picochlorum sp. SENEW3]|nr:hypothetical protein PSENEW3_00003075 [Picochlorum sp. SENEW3]
MASDDSFQETCERKSEDGRQIELIRKLLTICEGAEVRGGFDETIEEFSLPKNIRRLPFFHYTVVTPSAMTPATTNKRLKEIVKEHLGEIEHIFCPDQIMGRGTTTHSFFIVSLRCLNFFLNEIVSAEQKAKEALDMIYTASMEKTKYTEEVTRPARLCIRVQVDAYIQCKASDLDLEANESWKQLDQGVRKSFCTSVKDEARRAALKTLLSTASKISRSNKRRGTETNPLEHASPSSSKSAKRPLDLEGDGVQQDDVSPRSLVRPKMVPGDGSGDTSEQNASDEGAFDTSPDSILPQPTCPGIPAAELLPGFNGILPRRPDNGGQHDDALRLVQPEGKGSGIDLSSGHGYNNAIFDGLPDSVLPQPTCQETPVAESLLGVHGLVDDDILQNSTPGTPLFVNDNQDGFFMESYDPVAEANPFIFNDDENRSL